MRRSSAFLQFPWPDGISGIERVFLVANGDLQRLLRFALPPVGRVRAEERHVQCVLCATYRCRSSFHRERVRYCRRRPTRIADDPKARYQSSMRWNAGLSCDIYSPCKVLARRGAARARFLPRTDSTDAGADSAILAHRCTNLDFCGRRQNRSETSSPIHCHDQLLGMRHRRGVRRPRPLLLTRAYVVVHSGKCAATMLLSLYNVTLAGWLGLIQSRCLDVGRGT